MQKIEEGFMAAISVVPWVFVVDTDCENIRFEEDMVAYLTGECGYYLGGKESDLFFNQINPQDEHKFDNLTHEYGNTGPVVLCSTPGIFNHGLGMHYRDGQEEIAKIDLAKKQQEMGIIQKEMAKHPAYQSIGILWDEKPCAKAIEIMKDRAYKFLQYMKDMKDTNVRFVSDISIAGFRLAHQQITGTVQDV